MTVESSETKVQRCYLGIDPGKDKTGLALVGEDGSIMAAEVVKTGSFTAAVFRFLQGKLQVSNAWGLKTRLVGIVVGDGTNSKKQQQAIQKALPEIPLHIVDEMHTTEEARRLYWELFPPTGWRRFLPLGLLVPQEPLDGLAAAVQVRRYLKNSGQS